jgi:GH24 family phage-related lysozyme (muramidase)
MGIIPSRETALGALNTAARVLNPGYFEQKEAAQKPVANPRMSERAKDLSQLPQAPVAPEPVAPVRGVASTTVPTEQAPAPTTPVYYDTAGNPIPAKPVGQGPVHYDAESKQWVLDTQATGPVGPTEPAGPGPEPGAEEIAPTGVPGQGGPTSLSDNGVNYLKHVEHFSPKPYEDHGQISIGYGTRVRPGDKEITEEEAAQRLQDEVKPVENWINKNITGSLTQGQYDMLVSVGYNAGIGDKVGGKGALVNLKKEVNEGDWPKVYDHIRQYNKAKDLEGNHHIVPGLINRRENDIKLGQGEKAIEGVARLPAGQAKKLPAEAEKAQEKAQAKAEEAQQKGETPEGMTAKRGLLQQIFGGGLGAPGGQGGGDQGGIFGGGGWNPLEGITGPRKPGEESWNPLGFSSAQRQNLMMAGLGMAGGNPLGWSAFGAAVPALKTASEMQTAQQQREYAPAELALKAAQIPKFESMRTGTDFAGNPTYSIRETHTGNPLPTPGALPGGGAGSTGMNMSTDQINAGIKGNTAAERLQSVPGDIRPIVAMALSGEMPLEKIPSAMRKGVEQVASHVDNTWSPVVNAQRNKDYEQFMAPDKGDMAGVGYFNTTLHHMKGLHDTRQSIGDWGFKPFNQIANTIKGATGNSALESYNSFAEGVGTETAKALAGKTMAASERQHMVENVDASKPNSAFYSGNAANAELLLGKMLAADQKFRRITGGTRTPPDMIDPENRPIIREIFDAEPDAKLKAKRKERFGHNPLTADLVGGPPQTGAGGQGAAPAATEAPPVIKTKDEYAKLPPGAIFTDARDHQIKQKPLQ